MHLNFFSRFKAETERKRVALSAQTWQQFFVYAISDLTDYEMRPTEAEVQRIVNTAAQIADAALKVLEERFPPE